MAAPLIIQPRDIERFMAKVEYDTCGWGCWLWTGAVSRGQGNKQWYGSFRIGRQVIRAHRFSCLAFGTPVPPGHHRDHLCNISLCVRPDHLEPVTPTVNQERKIARAQRK